MLTEVRDSLQKALDEGKPFEEWKKEIVPKLEGKWLGRSVGELWDELSDEEKAKREPPSEKQREKIIAPERLELIFRTNMAVANAAGHYEQLMKTKAIYPYWRYVTRDDARVRDAHRALHNKVFKWDDPFWETYFPPNGFRCRCHVSPLTKRQVERDPKLHIEQSNITEDADGRKVLDVGGSYYKNNPGWDYNPGDSISHLVSLAKDNKKGRPAQVQADLEADLDKKEAEEAAAAKAKTEAEEKRKAKEAAAQAERERKIHELERIQQESQLRTERKKAAADAQEQAKRITEAHKTYRDNSPETLRKSREIHALSRSLEIHPYTSITKEDIEKLSKDHKAVEKLAQTRRSTLERDTSAKAKDLADRLNELANKKELTKDEENEIKKKTHELKRLEQLQTGLNNRLANAARAVEAYPQLRANHMAHDIINDINKTSQGFGLLARSDIAKECALEHTIAIQEKELLDQEIKETLKNNKSEDVVKRLDELQKSSAEALNRLQNTAQSVADDARKMNKDPMSYITRNNDAVEDGRQIAALRQQVTQLRLSTLSETERQKEEERLRLRRERQQTIHDANKDIFAGINDKNVAARKTKVMQREFDLMMYNFSDDELELYENYSRHHVAAKDPKDPNSNNNRLIKNYLFRKYYDPITNQWVVSQCDQHKGVCMVEFDKPSEERSKIGNYTPRFNWLTRFHEETHHLDAIFGYQYQTDSYVLMSHPTQEGKNFQDALIQESLIFINDARKKDGLPKLEAEKYTEPHTNATFKAVLYRLAKESIKFESNDGFANVTDIIGLCSHGAIDRDKLHGYKRTLTLSLYSPEDCAIRKLELRGHSTSYNQDNLRYPNVCYATTEGLASLTSARWCGSSKTKIYAIDTAFLPESCKKGADIIKRMVVKMRDNKFTWPKND